jgi:hypothetical protein
MAVDKEDAIYYLNTDGKVYKIAHPDSAAVQYGVTSASFITTACLRFAPDGSLILNRKTKTVYQIPPGGGTVTRFGTMNSNVAYFDFDANGNLYGGGKGEAIECILVDGSKVTSADYNDYAITALRVYDGYVYVAAQNSNEDDSTSVQEGIWKNEILDANGTLGANQLVINWSEHAGEDGPSITDFTFDEDGEMYIGQDKGSGIYLLNAMEYFYPEILKAPATWITWGNGKYIYINKQAEDTADRALIRVEFTKMGAVYHGR